MYNVEEMSKLPAVPIFGERLDNEQMEYAMMLRTKGEVSDDTWAAWLERLN